MKLAIALLATSACAQSISTFCVDIARTCSITTETVLTPSNIQYLKPLGTYTFSGQMYAQPLIAQGVNTTAGHKNLLVLATMAGDINAFDADHPGSSVIWSTHLNDPRTSFEAPRGGVDFYNAPMGCMGTPVLDVPNAFAYVACAGPAADSSATWTLYKVSLFDGSLSNSVLLSGTVSGTGSGGTTVSFSAVRQMQRCALLLLGGVVYVSVGSYADQDPWFGWVIGYNASTLVQTSIWNLSPDDKNVGLWGGGGGPASDGTSIYVVSGNTITTTYNPPSNLTESIIRLNSSLAVQDYFTPSDHLLRDQNDYDLGSSWAMLPPGTNLVVASGKRNSGYAVLRTDMGHLQGGGGTAPQVVAKASAFTDSVSTGTFGSALTLNGTVYWANKGGFQSQNKIFAFPITAGILPATPAATSPTSYPCCGAQMFGTCNGTANCIVWAFTPDTSLNSVAGSGTLRAFDPVTLAEIYTGPSFGTMPKFMHPVVWHGRVYCATLDGALIVYGLASTAMSGGAVSGGIVM